MKYLLGLILLVSVSASAQYSPTAAKTRFVNGIGLGTKDTATMNAADTVAMIVGRDSLVYFRYRGYWKPLAYNSSLGSYVKYTDTASMLSPYYRTAQATAALALKLNISDTAAMLSPYARTTTLGGYVPYTGATSNVNLGTKNIYANAIYTGFSAITASGTQVVLTVNSAPEILVSGSGGQTIKLPDATTLQNGTTYSFNNNQSSGAITINNNSNTLVVSIPSGGYAEVILLDNSIAAGSWDRHFQAPANVSWSTNTFDYPGSITSATWNGNVIAINRGGTGATTASAALTNLGGLAISDTATMLSPYIRTANYGLTKTGQGLGVDTALIATRLRVQKGIDSLGSIVSSGYVPYTGATGAVNLGAYGLTSSNILVSKNQNAGTVIEISNTTSGTSAAPILRFTGSNGSPEMGKFSATTNAVKTIKSNDYYLYNATSGNISILNDFATGNINLSTGGSSTAQMTLFSNGNLALGITSDNNARFQVSQNQNAATKITISNTTSGTSAASAITTFANVGSAEFGKFSSTTNAVKTIAASDAYLYNLTAGNISILNDFATGNINFGAGGVSTPQMTLSSGGRLLLGSTTDNGTDALQVTGNSRFTGNINVTGTSLLTGLVTVGATSGSNAGLSVRKSGIQIDAVETNGINGISLQSGKSTNTFNEISSNYFSGSTYLPLNLSARQTQGDLYLFPTGNIVVGSTTDLLAKFSVSGSVTAASAIARTQYINGTLVAAANSDVLVGLDINPTFTAGAFTGLSRLAARFTGNVLMGQTPSSLVAYTYVPLTLSNNATSALKTQLALVNGGGSSGAGNAIDFFTYTDVGNGNPGVRIASVDDGNFSNNLQIFTKAAGSSGAGALTNKMQIFGGTGNIVMQNGGTFTDNGTDKLQVTGSANFTSTVISNNFFNVKRNNSANSAGNGPYYQLENGLTSTSLRLNGLQMMTDGGFELWMYNGTSFLYNNYWDITGAYYNLPSGYFATASGSSFGIGTTTVGSKLQVNGNAAIGYNASTAAPTNGLVVSGTTLIGSTTDNGTDKLQVTGSSYFSTNVGIGTVTTGGYKFDVNGTARMGNTVISGTINVTSGTGSTLADVIISQYGTTGSVKQTISTLGGGTASSNAMQFNLYNGASNLGLLSLRGDGLVNIEAFNSSPTFNTSAILQVTSTVRGFLPPRMTTTQKNAIASPATGLIVYDTTLNKLAVFTGTVWEAITSL